MTDLTMVISKKDVDFSFIQQSKILDNTIPKGVKRIYVMNENTNPESLDYFRYRCPNLSVSSQPLSVYNDNTPECNERLIIHHGSEFQSPYLWRNLAIPYIDTSLTMFIFNDKFPVTIQSTMDSKYDWLLKLIKAADEYQDYHVFQPWIWEGKDTAHNFWKSLQFLRFNNRLYVDHRYDKEIRQCKMPESLHYTQQYAFLEDHCFMVRTEFLRNGWNMDEKSAFAKEIRDMCLVIYYQNRKILGCYNSQVIYLKDDNDHQKLKEILALNNEESKTCFTINDLLYFSWRRSTPVCYKALRHIEEKWGYVEKWDRINETLSFPRLNYFFNNCPKIMAPASTREHHKVILSILLSLGFDQFKLVSAGHKQHFHDFVRFYKHYLEYITNHDNSDGILIHARHTSLKDYQPETDNENNKSRHQFVHEGTVYSVQDDISGQVNVKINNSLPADTGLIIIQSRVNNQKSTILIHEHLVKEIGPDICITLVLSNTIFYFIRTSETRFQEILSRPVNKKLFGSFSIQIFNPEKDNRIFEINLEEIKDCYSHMTTRKSALPVNIVLWQKIIRTLSTKMMLLKQSLRNKHLAYRIFRRS